LNNRSIEALYNTARIFALRLWRGRPEKRSIF